jgi:hypothetical protein
MIGFLHAALISMLSLAEVATPAGGAPPSTGTLTATTKPTATATTTARPPAAVAERPAWLREPTGLRDGVYVMHVNSGAGFSRTDCEPKLRAEVEGRLREYVAGIVPAGAADAVPIDLDRLWPEIVTQEWEEVVVRENVPLVYLHVELRIDAGMRRDWQVEATKAVQAERNRMVMLGYGGAISAAAAAFALLKWSSRGRGAAAVLPATSVIAIIAGIAATMG